MNKNDLFKYSGNLYKKSLEIFINELKKKVPSFLQNNDLETSKKIIKQIENIKRLQIEIDSLSKNYDLYFPAEKAVPEISLQPKDQTENRIQHINELMEIMEEFYEVDLTDMKVRFYDKIIKNVNSNEINNNAKIPSLLNWEVNFYKTISFLLKKELIQIDERGLFILSITEKGNRYCGDDVSFEDEIQNSFEDENSLDIIEEGSVNWLIEHDHDMEFIIATRSYLLTYLIEEGILDKKEDPNYYKSIFHIVKNISTFEGLIVDKWDDIKEKTYYKIAVYLNDDEPIIFVDEKYPGNNILKCTDEDGSTVYYAFI